MNKNFLVRAPRLNEYYSQKLGYTSEEFGFQDWDSFSKFIWEYQKENGLAVDGICGQKTLEKLRGVVLMPDFGDYLILGGDKVKINERTIVYDMKNGCSLYDHPHMFGKRRKNIQRIIMHWDVTQSALSTFNALIGRSKRGDYASTHFCINYDGVIYQYADPIFHLAWHAAGDNVETIGVDMNNPVNVKFQDPKWLRPIINPRDYGLKFSKNSAYNKGFLGYTQAQLDSAKKLLNILCQATHVPLKAPALGKRYEIWDDFATCKGVFGHLNVDAKRRTKWDTIYTSDDFDYICS